MKTKKIKLKNNVVIPNNVFLAPMAGWTDVGFRSLAKEAGAGLCFTEMISAKALLYKNKKTFDMLATEDNEKPIAIQLFGNSPESFKKALELPIIQKFDVVDINMGCPAPKIVKNCEGSFLMTQIDLARQIIRTCVAATRKPVSVKFRLGWDEKNINAIEFAKMCEEEGVSFITVHGRTKSQGYSGKCNLDAIKEVVSSVKIPVIANGDIKSVEDAENVLKYTGAAGIMIGRGSLGNVEIFAKCCNQKFNLTKKEQIYKHFDVLGKYFSEKFVVLSMRKHLAYYLRGLKNYAEIMRQLMKEEDIKKVKNIIEQQLSNAE